MENIHFVNIDTGRHEFCDMKTWCLMYCNSLAARMIALIKMTGLPVIFSMKGVDGNGYIVAGDVEVNNSYMMAHEEGHLRLGHYEAGADVVCDDAGILNDVDAEIAADKYAIGKTKDPKMALDVLSAMIESIDATPTLDSSKKTQAKLEYARRMMAIANM